MSYYRGRMSSSCSMKSEDSDNDFDLDDGASLTNSSSNFSQLNSYASSSNYSLNDKRRSRNQNEKKRRDQFNLLIQELGNLLNHPRKIDKATVLNETLFFFRNYNDKPLYSKEIEFKYKPFFLQNDEFMRFMIEFQNAFCLVFDLNGQIKYVSDDIMHLLGHYPKNLQNCSLYDFVDEKSSKQIRNFLKRKFSPLDTICFDCKFKKSNATIESYEPIRIKGFFKKTPNSIESVGHFNTIAKLDSFMRINELYPRDNNKREFTTEFSMDLKYTSLDSKATEIIGYSPIEILGTCGYDYCHHDDIEKLIDCHKKLLQNGAVPLIAYRFRTKGQQWLWIQSRFQILYHQLIMKPYAIMANNHIISLNEMIESKDLIDNSDMNKFNNTNLTTTTTNTSSSSDYLIIDIKADNNNKIWQNQLRDSDRININQSQQQKFQYSPTQIEPISSNCKQQYMQLSVQQQNLQYPNQNKLGSNMVQQAAKADKHIDESLGSIFLRSFNDIEYRNYVLSQFKLKKQKIENTIKKHQDELKILEETMDNISDEKKLASWVMKFQRQEYNNNLYKNIQNNSIRNDQQQQQQQKNQTYHHQQTGIIQQQLLVSGNNNTSQYVIDTNLNHNNTSPNKVTNMNLQKTNKLIKTEYYDNNNDENNNKIIIEENIYNNRLEKTKNCLNESNTGANKILKRDFNSQPTLNEESELVGQLINLQNLLPNTLNSNISNNNNNNNNNINDNSNKNNNISINNNNVNQIEANMKKNSNSALNGIDIEDFNSEMMEKLFNNYTFDSFSSQ